MKWTGQNGSYAAQGTEADGGAAVELTIENIPGRNRPWELRAAGGVVGQTKTLTEAKELADLYCERGLSNEGNEYA